MKRSMQANDTRMAGSEPDEGVLLRVGSLQLVMTDKMALVDDLDGVLLASSVMRGL